jgi:hypothetical protein
LLSVSARILGKLHALPSVSARTLGKLYALPSVLARTFSKLRIFFFFLKKMPSVVPRTLGKPSYAVCWTVTTTFICRV